MPDRNLGLVDLVSAAIEVDTELPHNATKDLRPAFFKIRQGRSIRSVAREEGVSKTALAVCWKENRAYLVRHGPESVLGPALERKLVDTALSAAASGHAWPVSVLLHLASNVGSSAGVWPRGHVLSESWLKSLYVCDCMR